MREPTQALPIEGENERQALGFFERTVGGASGSTATQDVFLAVFAALDPKAFGAALRAWAGLWA